MKEAYPHPGGSRKGSMRVLILTPSAFPSISGNAVSAERWRQSLTKRGIDVDVLASAGLALSSFLEHLQRVRPDIIHAHHAFRAGALLADPQLALQQAGLAMIASPGGTDINEDLETPGRRETVLKVFTMARAIIAQSPQIIQRFKQNMPALIEKVVFVPKAVCWFGDEPFDLRGAAHCDPEDFLFLLPAGIRPVKGNLECLRILERIHRIRPGIRFVAAGPAVDREYAGLFEQEIRRHSNFARWIKAIPSVAMRSAYQAADVVLNASLSEGLSNSLIEAMAAGKPVLASDIPGNRWPILGEKGDSPAGLLYDLQNPEDFIKKALRLIDDGTFRESLGRAACASQSLWPDSGAEADGLIAVYRNALDQDAGVRTAGLSFLKKGVSKR
jgi:glycosyltransferase involved in cell wall biosynthesis